MHARRLPNTPRHPAQHSLCPCPGCPRPVPFPRDHAERFSAGPSATRTWGQQSIRSASSSPTVGMLAGPTLRRRSLWSREASYGVGGPSDVGTAVIGTPLVQDGRFRIPTRRFRNLSAGWRMAVQLMDAAGGYSPYARGLSTASPTGGRGPRRPRAAGRTTESRARRPHPAQSHSCREKAPSNRRADRRHPETGAATLAREAAILRERTRGGVRVQSVSSE